MTSVVDTSVKHFHSGMVGAPVLNGVAGSLAALLDACLITGFDLKSATSLVVDAGVATLSFAGQHSATVDSVVLVEGSSVAALNGEQKVTDIGSGVVKFATAAPDGTATGTITIKMAPAGWTQPFVGTNLATYKSADPASKGMILRVDDTATTQARVVGYEKMTDINTGAGPFPTDLQMPGGGYWGKSGGANINPVQWDIQGDGLKFHLTICAYTGSGSIYTAYQSGVVLSFGDDISTRPGGDPYACSLNYSPSTSFGDPSLTFISTNLYTAMPRSYSGLGGSALYYPRPYVGAISSASGCDSTLGAFPSVVDGGLRLSRMFFKSNAFTNPRSDIPGLFYAPMSAVYDTFKNRDIVPGTGALTGRKLLALATTNVTNTGSPSTSTNTGVSFVDITGPWR